MNGYRFEVLISLRETCDGHMFACKAPAVGVYVRKADRQVYYVCAPCAVRIACGGMAVSVAPPGGEP